MTRIHYHRVDVFTSRVFGGNQLAVITNGRGIAPTVMQAIAKEFNLSETTFVLPSDDTSNDFKVRIFTPGAELPMAGHPTVGTAYVVVRERMLNPSGSEVNLCFEEGVGPIPVRVLLKDGVPDMIWMTQPLPTFGPEFRDRAAIAEMLCIGPDDLVSDLPLEVVSCGVPFLYVPVRDLQTVKSVSLRTDLLERTLGGFSTDAVFVFAQEAETDEGTVHSRMFAPSFGVPEDPATGSASGPLGCYLARYGLVKAGGIARILSEQGFEMGRPSLIHIEIDTEGEEITGVRVGGQCVYMGEGFLELPSLSNC